MLGHYLTLLISCLLLSTIAGAGAGYNQTGDDGNRTCINEKYSLALSYMILFQQNLDEPVAKELIEEDFKIFGKNGNDGYSSSVQAFLYPEKGDFIQAVVAYRKVFSEQFNGDIKISDALKYIFGAGKTFNMTILVQPKFSGKSLKSGVVADLLLAGGIVVKSALSGKSENDLVDELRKAGATVDIFGRVVNCISELVDGQTLTEKQGIWNDLVHATSILGDNLKA